MNPAYPDLAFAVFALMAANVPFQRALTRAQQKVLGKYRYTDIKAAEDLLTAKVNHWNRAGSGVG